MIGLLFLVTYTVLSMLSVRLSRQVQRELRAKHKRWS